MKVAVFHPGTQHSWQTASALQRLDRLEWFATSLFHDPDRWPYRLERTLPAPLARHLSREFNRFRHAALNPRLVRTAGMLEWIERLAARSGARALAGWLDGIGNRRFARLLEGEIRSARPFALWGYDGSSLESFRLARECGRLCILDRTIGDPRAHNRIMAEVIAADPAWFLPGAAEIPQALIDRADAEYETSDTILAGCDLAAQTIRENARDPAVAARVRVLEYCYDEALFGALPPPRPLPSNEPVRFLFVGQVVPRKGVQHVLEAIARIPPAAASLTMVGPLGVPRDAFAAYADRVDFRPNVARSEVPAIMARHHCLVLPSHFEGSAISLLEGLASGLALIQSAAAGCGVTPATGLSLARVSTDAVHAAMMTAVEDRARLDGWRMSAQSRARDFSFERYCGRIAALLEDIAPV